RAFLRLAQRRPGGEQSLDCVLLAAGELVDRPRRNRRLAELLDLLGARPVAVALQTAGKLVPRSGELLGRKLEELVDLVVEVSHRSADYACGLPPESGFRPFSALASASKARSRLA